MYDTDEDEHEDWDKPVEDGPLFPVVANTSPESRKLDATLHGTGTQEIFKVLVW